MSATSPASPFAAFASPVSPPAPPITNSRFIPTVNACYCLNLQLSLSPLNPSPTAANAATTTTEPALLHALTSDPSSPFYTHQCQLGHLDSKTIQHESLTLVRAFVLHSTHWVLFRCLGCRMDCFAVEADGMDGRCVMRLDMLYNEEIAELHTSSAYSAAFSLLIPTPHSSPLTSPSGGGERSVAGTGVVGSAAESLRTALDRSIHAEQLAMQMRINQFVAEEQARFAAWEKKGRRELSQLLAFLQETNSGRQSITTEAPGSPFIPRSPAAVPLSPRPSSPTSVTPASVFQPLHTFLRRPSRQSPRLQRLLMDGLRHGSTLSPTDSHSPAASIHTIDTSDGDDSGSTPRMNQPNLSSSLPRTGRMSPRQSVSGLAVPQLSGLMRRGSRTEEVDDEAEADVHNSTDMIVRWREQDEEMQREEDRRHESAKQRRSAASQRRTAAAKDRRQRDGDEEEEEEDIFQLDTTSTEDSWTGERAERDEEEEEERDEDEAGMREEKDSSQSRVMEVMDDSTDAEEAVDEVHEDGALSDDEAVATTSQADILAIARRSVPFVPIPSTTSHSSTTRGASSRQLGLVPSSLPIPIPAPLRQLINKQRQQDQQTTNLSTSLNRQPATIPPSYAAVQSATSSNANSANPNLALSSSIVDAPRRSSLHSLALERKQQLHRSQPITEATTYTAQRSLSPEPTQAPATSGQQDNEAEPFIPPHTLVAEPYFSFSKFRHLAGVKVAGSVSGGSGAGMGGGMLSSSVPSRSMMSSVLFRKDEESQLRKSAGASALSAALGGRRSGGDASGK